MRACQVTSIMSHFATPWTVAQQAPLSLGFSRQEYWSGLPCPPPGIEPASLTSPALAGGLCTTSTTWEAPGLKRRGLKISGGKRQCSVRTPGGAAPHSCPCSDLTSSPEMLWKVLSWQMQETLKAIAGLLLLPGLSAST